jgi:hypothetical protein
MLSVIERGKAFSYRWVAKFLFIWWEVLLDKAATSIAVLPEICVLEVL